MKKLALCLILISASLSTACQDLEEAPECLGSLPATACPTNRGGSCSDTTCDSLYRCTFEGWVKVKDCERTDAGADATADAVVDVATDNTQSDASCTTKSPIPGATTGCTPPLSQGDCPVEIALTCVERACTTGCASFLVCRANGWEEAAYCDDTTNKLIWIDGF